MRRQRQKASLPYAIRSRGRIGSIGWSQSLFGPSLPSEFTFTRASSASVYGSDGIIATKSTDVARFDYNPAKLTQSGFLIEGSRTNLITSSNTFTSGWVLTGSPTVTGSAVNAPGGTLTGTQIARTTTANTYAEHSITKPASALTYTFTLYAKKGLVGNYVALRMQGTYPARADVVINLDTGVISTAASATSTFTSASCTITAVGNGWYRIALTATTDTATALKAMFSPNSGGGVLDAVDSSSTSSCYVFGAQLEQSIFASSYIPTTGTSATRAAENAFISNLSTIGYNQTQGTVYVEYVPMVTVMPSYGMVLSLSDRTLGNRMVFEHTNLGNIRCRIQSGGSTIIGGGGFDGLVAGTVYKMALAYAQNDFAFSAGGSIRASASSGTPPVVTDLTIGSFAPTATDQTYGWFRRVAVYPTRLTNAQINAMTA